MNEQKKWDPAISVWPSKKGTGHSLYIKDEARLNEIMAVLGTAKVGSTIYVQEYPNRNSLRNQPSFRIVVKAPSTGASAALPGATEDWI